jgi:prephenate dehydratase
LSKIGLKLSSPSKVAFQGEIGAYSEVAARHFFENATLFPCKSFAEVFDQVQKKEVDFGVVPIENSTEGSVNEVYDLLLERNLFIVGEYPLRIEHCLIGFPNAEIKDVYSHPQALAQCRKFLEKRNLKPVAFYDTAGAVKYIKEKNLKQSGAIASASAAKHYGMKIIESGIEDNKNNYTRFVVISKSPSKSEGKNKTSIIFSVKHEPGALYSILEEFAKRRVNLTKIESRPTKEKAWEYIFYLDFEGDLRDKGCSEALERSRDKSIFVKILGSYPEI